MKIWQINDPKERSAAWAAKEANRRRVTVSWLLDHPDEYAYEYNNDNAEFGLDPWRMVEGVDKLNNGNFDLWYCSGTSKEVTSNYRVYVKA